MTIFTLSVVSPPSFFRGIKESAGDEEKDCSQCDSKFIAQYRREPDFGLHFTCYG
ncbi:hypothetical protein [Paraburkholderia nemoris]|uniref:hypothetical protein n=1 Tax=Paraburkholderia nemoris TaxID=2793076 RepID=UPI00155F067F|nr:MULTISPECIES: hypothetical protein [Paraburkholderia]MBK3813732.1 hypothetical protein [Paraburkholderia aspalathi]